MQQLPGIDKRLTKIWAKERGVGEHLPYAAHVDHRTIRMRNGRLMQVLKLDGLAFETADAVELDRRKTLLDSALKAVGSPRIGLYHHVVRRRVEHELGKNFANQFSKSLDADWALQQANKSLFENQLFLAVILDPSESTGSLFDRVFGRADSRRRDSLEAKLADEIRLLTDTVDSLEASLFAYGPSVLECYDREGSKYSELLEYLSMLLSGDPTRVAISDGDIGHYIPRSRISFGTNSAELGYRDREGPKFVGILAIKEYPSKTSAGILDEIARLPFELHVSQSFGFLDRRAATGRIARVVRRMRSAEDDAVTLRNELLEAKDNSASGRAMFGEHHLTVAVFGHSEDELDTLIAEVRAMFGTLGIVAVREDMALETSFWGQFPGNFSYIPRKATISSRNFASLASLHNFPDGSQPEEHWGTAVSILETTAQGPYHFSFHVGDLGNFLVIGPSGSGKTVALNFLLAQAQRLNPRIVLFDKDRGSELFVRAIGGTYDRLRTGIETTFNPLQLEDIPENRAFLVDLVCQLVKRENQEPTSSERARIVSAVDANMEALKEVRQFKFFAELLRGSERPSSDDLYARFEPWWGDGEHSWLFDNVRDRLDLAADTVGFDMTQILDKPNLRTPAMMYLFHRVEQRLDGNPAIIVIDEGWKALDDEVFVRQIRDWEKTIRKRNGIVGFATQNAEDALESQIASAVIEQSATQIFLPNPQASAEAYMGGFGLSQHELNLVRALPKTSRAFLVKQAGQSAILRLDLSSQPDKLEILAGRERSVRVLDKLCEEHKGLPVDWTDQLLARIAR